MTFKTGNIGWFIKYTRILGINNKSQVKFSNHSGSKNNKLVPGWLDMALYAIHFGMGGSLPGSIIRHDICVTLVITR